MAAYLAKRATIYLGGLAALLGVPMAFATVSPLLPPGWVDDAGVALGLIAAGWAVSIPTALWWLTRQARRCQALLRRVASSMGKERSGDERSFVQKGPNGLRVEVGPADAAGRDAWVASVSLPTEAWRWRSWADAPDDEPTTPVGDPVFDAAVALRRTGPDLLAVLTPNARRALAAFVAEGGRVRGRSYERTWPRSTPPDEVEAGIQSMIALARRLRVGADAPLGLAERWEDPAEPEPLRRAALRVLLTRHREHHRALEIARSLYDSEDPALALLAARALRLPRPDLEAALAEAGGGLSLASEGGELGFVEGGELALEEDGTLGLAEEAEAPEPRRAWWRRRRETPGSG